MKKNISFQKNRQGFVLLEAILAVGMLSTIFAAAISLYSSSVSGMRMTNDQLIATYLAQDGVEQMIARRQHNYENHEDWLQGISCPTAPCAVDYFVEDITTDLEACANLTNGCQLFIDANGVYSHNPSGGTLSYFSRTVEVTENGPEARVVVTVSWNDSGKTLSVPISYVLYDNPNNNMTNP